MAIEWTGKWAGGRTYVANEKTVFVIEKMRHGRRYTTPLDVAGEREALAELALFERDPQAYLTRAQTKERRAAEAVQMTAENVKRFLDHLKTQQRTEKYRRNVRSYLAEWAVPLAGRDLRALSLQDLKRMLSQWSTARKARIIAIKSFFSFLREEEAVLTSGMDATLDLKVPQARPGKKLDERAYDMKLVERFYRAIEVQAIRDLLCVLAKTGLHATEVDRVARGEGELQSLKDQGEIAGTVRLIHKSGDEHVQSLDAQTFAAFQRLVQRGQAPVESYVRKEIRAVARRLRRPPLKFGRLRHCFVTWAQDVGVEVRPKAGGVPLATVAGIVGHKSARTTKLFYTGYRVPVLIRLPTLLEHSLDPAPLEQRTGQRSRA
jgi:integrase